MLGGTQRVQASECLCAERDVHQGSLRAFMLSELPAAVRREAAGLKGKPMPVGLVRRDIIRPEVLELHRR